MAEAALIDDIRRAADAEIEAAWEAARRDADACRAGCARAVQLAREAAEDRVERARAAAEIAAGTRAEAIARRIRAEATAALADRLHQTAVEALAQFRGPDYPELFAALVRELPAQRWHLATVHPDDEPLARHHLPNARIVCDPSVGAGLMVESDDGRLRVNNTLRTRFEAAWPDLVTRLVRDARDEASRL